jgi:glycerol-3-phosphate dehydrogenase
MTDSPFPTRPAAWEALASQKWDVLVIGGGITGAGILREAVRRGLKAALVEQRDFAWGTSSRSSKLVHGGLRYLKEGRLGLTRASVLEREQLLQDCPGLIDPLGFLLTIYEGDNPGKLVFEAGLTIYDLLALRWGHRYYSPEEFRLLAPHIAPGGLQGGFRYGDAQTDDARLTLRVLQEACAAGGLALNYTAAESLLRDDGGQVNGAILRDTLSGETCKARAALVVNATGAWADRLRGQVGAAARIRPLRGSHLIFPAWRLPVAQAVSFLHPLDRRPVFIFPWEGVTLVGTTDVDHHGSLADEPGISAEETSYLMAAVEAQFPSLHLGLDDVSAAFAGIRPVVGSGQADPSKESRDHVVWEEQSLLTVTGGKLTTFRLIARDALEAVEVRFPAAVELPADTPALDRVELPLPEGAALEAGEWRRLLGRYGAQAPALVETAQAGELEHIPGAPYLWAELRWAARAEQVQRLEDLLLRRTRLGLLLPEGGLRLAAEIRRVCQAALGWDDARWEAELAEYGELWRRAYWLPAGPVPDWKAPLEQARRERALAYHRRHHARRKAALAGGLLGAALGLGLLAWLMSRRTSS